METSDLRAAALQDIDSSSVKEQFQGIEARNCNDFVAEYGTRGDDGALVLHFFPPGYPLAEAADWPDYDAFHNKLEAALLRHFAPAVAAKALEAGYVEELRSFFVIVAPSAAVPDTNALLNAFFRDLEA